MQPNRSGATLTEVLITLLIMAIGVVTCATLFPISLMRSVRATNLTHAAILRQNVETSLDINPSILFDPDGDWNPAVDDNGLHEHVRTPSTLFTGTPQPVYVIDPLGGIITGSPTLGSAPRYTLGVANETVARRVVSLPQWSLIGEDVPVATTLGTAANPNDPQSVTFDPQSTTIDLSTAFSTASSGVNVRAVIFNSTGRISEVRDLTPADITPPTIQWSPPLNDPRFYSSPPSNVTIEHEVHDYTWLLTVRNNGNTTNPAQTEWPLSAEVDVAIFFRRGFAPGDEQVFSPAAPGNNYTIEGAGAKYTIRWPGSDKPAIKKGGYVLDVEHGRWYRIESLADSGNSATFVLDQSSVETIDEAVFMRGIVEVFRIGKKAAEIILDPVTNLPRFK